MNALVERIRSRVTVTADGCWEWTGAITHSGYANVKVAGKSCVAHRVLYELLVGPIPDGMMLDHECHNRSDCAGGTTCRHRRCVNPDHLSIVTPRGNVLSSARTKPGAQARKTHCVKGHPLSGANLYREGRRRHCRTCRAERKRASRRGTTPIEVRTRCGMSALGARR